MQEPLLLPLHLLDLYLLQFRGLCLGADDSTALLHFSCSSFIAHISKSGLFGGDPTDFEGTHTQSI